MDRRSFLKVAAGSALGLGLFGWREALAASKKKLIVLWMEGGPSQLDTFDPKPGTDHGGPFAAIESAVRGIRVSEHLPRVAKEMKSIALVRSMISKEGSHPRAKYLLHTGYSPGGAVRHPSLGAVFSHEVGGEEGELPAFVSIGGVPVGSGFLGAASAPFFVNKPGEPNPNLEFPSEVTEERFQSRRALLDVLEKESAAKLPAAESAHRAAREKALRMMRSDKVKAFDLSEEPEKLKRDYGDNELGRGALIARRLVESGVKAVEVALKGWDTHQDNFDRVRELSAMLDPAMASLIADLRARGLLEETLVVWMGEFGRTPKINGNQGRDHFPGGYSVALAGAGIRGGTVVGATSEDGMRIVDRPVTVPELFATIYHGLGLDLSRVFATPAGRPISIVDQGGAPIRELV